MSTIAMIQVRQCDGCREVAVLHDDEDHDSFTANWFEGLNKDFCTACKDKVENAAAIEADEETVAKLLERAEDRVFGSSDPQLCNSETSQLCDSATSQLPKEAANV